MALLPEPLVARDVPLHRRRGERGRAAAREAQHRRPRGARLRGLVARHDRGRRVEHLQRRPARLRPVAARHDGAADAEPVPLPDRPLPRPLRPHLPRHRPRAHRRPVRRRTRRRDRRADPRARAASCRCPTATSRGSSSAARSAGCCSSSTRRRPRSAASGRCSRSSSTTWCRTSSRCRRRSAADCRCRPRSRPTRSRHDAFEKGFLHVTSHVSDPLPAAVGRAVVRTVLAEDLGARAVTMGARLRAGLEELQRRHEPIGDVRGVGLMLGVDLVSDRETREPDTAYGSAVTERCLELGLNVNIVKFAGLGSVLRIAPPLTIARRGHRPRARDPRSRAGRLPLTGQRVNAPRCPGRTIGRYTEPGAPACPTPPKPRPRSPSTRPSRSAVRTQSGLAPVVFIHGLWLLPSSWDRWADGVRGGRLHGTDAGLARRPRDRRGGQRAPRGVRGQDGRPGRRPLRRDHPQARPQAGRDRPLLRRPADADHRRPRPRRRLGRDRPGARSAACSRCRSRR